MLIGAIARACTPPGSRCWPAFCRSPIWVSRITGLPPPTARILRCSRFSGPAASIGLKLGFVGLGLFLVLFLYPIRKRWPWLGRIGKTKHWLDFHVLAGISAPIVITLHSSLKLSGLAGLAYWIMMAVALSGFAGRYLYAQIPRSLNAAELSLQEMQALSAQLTQELERQALLKSEEVAPLLKLPDAGRGGTNVRIGRAVVDVSDGHRASVSSEPAAAQSAIGRRTWC